MWLVDRVQFWNPQRLNWDAWCVAWYTLPLSIWLVVIEGRRLFHTFHCIVFGPSEIPGRQIKSPAPLWILLWYLRIRNNPKFAIAYPRVVSSSWRIGTNLSSEIRKKISFFFANWFYYDDSKKVRYGALIFFSKKLQQEEKKEGKKMEKPKKNSQKVINIYIEQWFNIVFFQMPMNRWWCLLQKSVQHIRITTKHFHSWCEVVG